MTPRDGQKLGLIVLENATRIMMKYFSTTLTLFTFAVANASCATTKYKDTVVQLACGDARYELTSTCRKSADPFELNECKPQSLLVEIMNSKRHTQLPELPKSEVKRIRAAGGNLKSLFVVSWACSAAAQGPIVTLKYSIGGGSAEYSETWSHYDKAGKLIESESKLSVDEVKAVERNFKKVPSIMPD